MPKIIEIDNGEVIATENLGDGPDGKPQVNRWRAGNAEQAEKLLATWNGSDATQKMRAGDISAVQDAARDFKREQQKLGR